MDLEFSDKFRIFAKQKHKTRWKIKNYSPLSVIMTLSRNCTGR